MVLSIHPYKAIVAVTMVAFLAAPANAQVPKLAPFNYELKYDVTWNNLPIGRIRILTTENEYRYAVNADIKTRGIVRMIDSTESTIKAQGRFDDDTKKPLGVSYESKATNDDSVKTTTIRYGELGEIVKRDRVPADDPANRPPVPIEQTKDSVDPMSALYIVRKRLHDSIAANVRDTTVRTYDGARLADMTITVISRAQLESMGKHVDAINMIFKRTPIAGYKDKELKKYKKGDPTIHVYFSTDEDFIPIQADIELGFGTITAKLAEKTSKN